MKTFNLVSPHAHWLLRAVLASVFVYHGVLKLSNLEGFAQMLPISFTQTVLVALAELVGGVLVLIGGFGTDRWSDLATRLGAARAPTLPGQLPAARLRLGRGGTAL